MANYEGLKSAIKSVIKTNGNNEITGDILQNALLSMINSLGTGYQFMGIATPETDPGILDQKVYYIAKGKGTYTNFGGINVDENEVVLLTYNGIWSKLKTGIVNNFKTINNHEITGEGNIEIQGGSSITVDDAFSDTSVNPVQNKVITAQIKTMNELLAQLDEKVFPTTLSVSGGGTYDEGTSQTVTVSWKLMKNGQTLTPDSVTVNGESVDPATGYKVFTDVTITTTYRVSVVYKGKTYTGSTTATFKRTYYRYYGAAPLATDFNNLPDEVVSGFTKEVATSKEAYNVAITIPVEGICTYIYPKRFGTLTQVQDVNAGGAAADNWTISTPSTTPEPVATKVIGGEECYIYRSTQPNYEDTFKFNFK